MCSTNTVVLINTSYFKNAFLILTNSNFRQMWSIIHKKQNDNSFFFFMKMTEIKLHSLRKISCLLPKPWMHILNTAAILASSFYLFILPYQWCQHSWLGATDWEPKTRQGRGRKVQFRKQNQMSTEKAIPKISIFWNSKPVKDNRSYKMLCIITSKFASYQKNKLLKTSSDE